MTNNIETEATHSVDHIRAVRLGRDAYQRIALALIEAAGGDRRSATRDVHFVSISLPWFAIDLKVMTKDPTAALRGIRPSHEAFAWLRDKLTDLTLVGHRPVVLGTNLLEFDINIFPVRGMPRFARALVPTLQLVVSGLSINDLYDGLDSPYGRPYPRNPIIVVRPVGQLWFGVELALRVERKAQVRVRGTLRHAGDALRTQMLRNWLNAKAPRETFVYGIGREHYRLQRVELAELTDGALFKPSSGVSPDSPNVRDDGHQS